MTKNSQKINEKIKAISSKPYEIVSGTMVSGSFDEGQQTISVLQTGGSKPTEGVTLNVITGNDNGIMLVPRDCCDVIIGCVDGPGEWTLIKAGEIIKATITIGEVTYEMDSSQVKIQNGDVILHVGASAIKINTASESLFQLLKDCFTYLTELTVPTPSGVSGIPTNVADFTDLLTRLNNLLAA